jgi:FMN phosphatase YigB (HAD superfamily)
LAKHLVHVEVSATSGFCKPHPEPFEIVREKLGVPMERVLMVGDDFWADIVGGHRAGFLTALSHEHRQGPTSDARAPEVSADRILTDLRQLLED